MDIGASEIWVDVGVENDPEPVRRFETFTADLNRMAQWLNDCGIRTVVMESTGVYWIPACQILGDRGIEVLLANPRYAKNVSGRKTDALDCQWPRSSGRNPQRYDVGVLATLLNDHLKWRPIGQLELPTVLKYSSIAWLSHAI